jgi:negative regulator of sigma E activity
MMKPATQARANEYEDDSLSAFLDGELSDEQARLVVRRLDSSAEDQARLREYYAVSDALRGLHSRDSAPDLTARVMAALEQEPTVLAPMRKPKDRRAALWLAAAAITAITWGLWNSLPQQSAAIPMAANDVPPSLDVQPYLAAHQDFAEAVITPAEMNFTPVSLSGGRP